MSLRTVLIAVALLAGGHAAVAQEVSGITIYSYGIYRADLKMAKPVPEQKLVPAVQAKNICHVMTTWTIPASDKQLFGIRYRLDGEPRGGLVEIRRKVRFPDSWKSDNGPEGYSLMEGVSQHRIGVLVYGGWGISEDSKPGIWEIQLFHRDRKLIDLNFTVTKDKSFKVVPDKDSECFLVSDAVQRPDTRIAGR